MSIFRPWDADDEEYSQRLQIRELLPDTLRPAVDRWIAKQLDNGYDVVGQDQLNAIRSALHASLTFRPGAVQLGEFLEELHRQGDQFTMRVVDLLLSQSPHNFDGSIPKTVLELGWHLDQNMSAATIEATGTVYRLRRRLPEGVEDLAERAVSDANAAAGRHLKKAWEEMRGLTPNASSVMTEAIRAVEAAGGAVVIPNDKRPQLSKIVGALKDTPAWTLVLPTRDDGVPDQRLVLIGMLETLAFAEQHRHSGAEPTAVVAQAHVQLAALLVGWFSGGAVVKSGS